MPRILLLNPNTTSAVTDLMMAAGQGVASPGTTLVPLTAPRGFPYISTRAEAQIGGAVVLEMLAEMHREVDGAIVAAFGDPGLLGARELFDIPVIGVSEAAMLTACMLGQRFAVVTFTRALCPWFRDCVELHGLGGRCAGIVGLDGLVSSIEEVQERNEDRLVRLADETVRDTGADVLIFAGAPLAGLASRVRGRLPVPVVDPVAAAVKQAELLVALASRKAVGGGLARRAPKASIGLLAPLADRMSHADAAPDRPVVFETGTIILAGTRYTVQRDFGDLPATIVRARVSMIAVDRDGHVHVLRRGPMPVVVFDADGRFLFSYGEGHIFDSHGITIDDQNRVFIVDRDAHQVLCFEADGTFAFDLGSRHTPHWQEPFNHPTKVAVAADGEIYVADGYGNARVHRFDGTGRLRSSFGVVGHGPGAFMTPHSILVDSRDRVLVCDRENDRVQVFDRAGAWLASWDGLCRPMDLCALPDGTILVTDQVPSLNAFDPDGTRIGRARPSLNGSHGIAIDSQGSLYLAEIDPTSITKLAVQGADGNAR